jgi:hypothetical protein
MSNTQEFIDQYKLGKVPESTMIKMALFREELRKAASVKDFSSFTRLLGALLLGGAATAGATAGVKKLDKMYFEDNRREQAKAAMLLKFPELVKEYGEELVGDYFKSLWHFSPHIANDPMAARSYIKQALNLHGVGGPTYLTYKDLIDAQGKSLNQSGGDYASLAFEKPMIALQNVGGLFSGAE